MVSETNLSNFLDLIDSQLQVKSRQILREAAYMGGRGYWHDVLINLPLYCVLCHIMFQRNVCKLLIEETGLNPWM